MHFHIPADNVSAIQYDWHRDNSSAHLKAECLAFPEEVCQAELLFSGRRLIPLRPYPVPIPKVPMPLRLPPPLHQ